MWSTGVLPGTLCASQQHCAWPTGLTERPYGGREDKRYFSQQERHQVACSMSTHPVTRSAEVLLHAQCKQRTDAVDEAVLDVQEPVECERQRRGARGEEDLHKGYQLIAVRALQPSHARHAMPGN